MKNILKKLKENWLDYLVILISFLAVLFVYTFTAFYQPKESEKTINKENIVKVLREKKNRIEDNIYTDGSPFVLATIRPHDDPSNKYFANMLLSINSVYIDIINNTNVSEITISIDSAIRFEIMSFNIDFNFSATTQGVNHEFTFVIETQAINSIEELESIGLGIDLQDIYSEGGLEENYLDIGMELDFDILLNGIDQQDSHFYFNEYYSSYIDTNNLPVSVQQNIYNNVLFPFEEYGIFFQRNSFAIFFNTQFAGYDIGYNTGYGAGYDTGYDSGFDYGQELGYQNGYNDGVIVGSNNFNILNLIRSLFDLLWDVLSVEMLPNIKLIYIVAIPLVLSVIKFILGWFR